MHSFFVDPACFDVVVVQGKDAERFLQGQVTCDVTALADGGQTYGACCNNKGRIIAAFTLVRVAETFHLCMSKGTGELFIAALRKFLPFYKCTMALVDATQRLVALHGEHIKIILTLIGETGVDATNGKVLLTHDGWICPLDGAEPRALWLCKRSPSEIAQTLNYASHGGELETWEAMAMLAGHYPFHANDTERFTPQELHYDQNGYVSFSKGCYTGQEIVARMHYRGKHKKQLFLVVVKASNLSDGTLSLRDNAGTPVGASVVTRKLGAFILGLVELPHDFAASIADLESPAGTIVAVHTFDKTVIQLATLVSD